MPSLGWRQLPQSKISVGCELLDAFLRGGIPCGSITELVGEAAACKTQTCLQLLLSAVRPSKTQQAGTALSMNTIYRYLYLEGDPPIRRLQELATVNFSPDGGLLENILVKHCIHSQADLLENIARAGELAKRCNDTAPLRLMIVDSVAHLFRDPGSTDDNAYIERASTFFEIATLLKKLAYTYNLAVLVTNQVTDVMEGSSTQSASGMKLQSSGREVAPALGLAWSNCITTRLFLSKAPDQMYEQGVQTTLRCMQIVISPSLPQSYCYFTVSREGVKGLKNSGHAA